MEKNKKIIIGIIAIIVIILIITTTVLMLSNKKRPEDTLKDYFYKLSNKNYEEMYEMLSKNSKESISKEDFINRNKNIYEGIEAENIEIEIKDINKEKTTINYNIKMDTTAGKIELENKINIVKEEKQNKIQWSSSDIFPNLTNNDKVRVKTEKGKRGNIYDRNQKLLAGEGTASSIGLVPGKMNKETKLQDIQTLANLLDVSEEKINQTLNASWVKEDSFVPIRTVEKTQQELKDKTLEIKGVKIIFLFFGL